MKILETRVYRGPNLYALWPVLRLHVDLEELEDFPTGRLPGFPEKLLALLPTLAEHTCSYEEPGGFVRRMTEGEGTWMGHVLEHVAIELQCLVGSPVSFGKTRGAGLPRGHYHVVYTYQEEAVGVAAGELALAVIRHLLHEERADHDPRPFDFPAERNALRQTLEEHALGPSTAALVRAAEERDIPWMRLNDRSLIQLGHGRYQQRIEAAVTSGTALTAVKLIAVLGAPGDRRDEDIRELARAAAPVFDLFLLREDDDRRGRAPGEAGELLREGLSATGVAADRILPEVLGEAAAVDRALALARPGDLLVVFGDKLDRSWRQITGFDPARTEARRHLAAVR